MSVNLQAWQVIRSKRVLSNRWAQVNKDVCRLPNGSVLEDYYYWVGGDFCQAVAVTDDRLVLLVEQYKHGVKEIVLELPGGLIDDEEASPLSAAQRELREETGYTSDHWSKLTYLHVSSAKATTKAHLFLATNATKVSDPSFDANEQIRVVAVPIEELMSLIQKGRIRDASSVAGCLLALTNLSK